MDQQRYVDIDYIIREIGIEADALLELLSIYISEISQEMLRVKEYLENQDWTGLQRSIHTIKGVSANLLIHQMHETAAAIDFKLKAMDLDNIKNDIDRLISIYAATEAEIEDILGSGGYKG